MIVTKITFKILSQIKKIGELLVVAILFLSLFLFILPMIQATTIQELINSYSFDYYGKKVDIINVTDYMQDGDSNGVNDTLSFNISYANGTSGSYSFHIDVEDGDEVVMGETTESVSISGGEVIVNISTELLSGNNMFNYTLRVYDVNDSLEYREGGFVTQNYPSYEEGYWIVSVSDANIGNNLIRLNITINSSKSAVENVSAFLSYNDSFISSVKQASLSSSSLNYVIVDFDNETIKSTHYNEAYIIDRIVIGTKSIFLNQTTSSYDYEDFAKTSYLKSYNDSFIDLDADNLTDSLQLNFTLNIKTSGVHTVEAEIYDLYGEYLITLSKNQSLSTGNQVISININGSDIYSSGLNGPYEISISRLIFNNETIDSWLNAYVTNISSHQDFERPPLPDLNISMNVYYNGTDNLVNVSVYNIGTATAFNVFVDVFDTNDTYEGQDSLAILNVSDSQIFNFVANATVNNSIFVAVVDFDNLVDELNESNNVASNAIPPNITSVVIFNESGIVGGDVVQGENVSFNVTVTDDNSDVDSVWLKIWQGVVGVSAVIWQGFLGFVTGNLFSVDVETNESFPIGEVNYTLYANDTSGNEVNESGSFSVVEINPPSVTSLTETPSDPATYSQGAIYEFNATITDANLQTILLEFNGVNYSASGIGDVYNVTLVDLSAGSYNYRWYANDTFGNVNNSESGDYTLNKIPLSGNLTNNRAWVFEYDEVEANISYSESNAGDGDVVYKIFKDGVDKGGSDLEAGFGNYSYKLNSTGGANYSANSSMDVQTLFIDKNSTYVLSISASPSWAETYETAVNVSGDGPAELSYKLFKNDTGEVSIGQDVVYGTGSYNFSYNTTGNVNYSSAGVSSVLVISKATPSLTFLANSGTSNLSLTYPQQVNISATASGGTVVLYRDGVDVLSENHLNITLGVGSYIYRAEITGNENYTDVGASYYNITITQATGEVYTYVDGSRSNTTTGNHLSIWLNSTLQTGEADIKLYNNGTLINSGSSPLENYTLFDDVGLYNITTIYESTQNYSSGYETWWLEVTDTTLPNITSVIMLNASNDVDGDVVQRDNLSFNVTVTDDVDVDSVWLKIWQGVAEVSNVIWQGFLSFVSGDLWSVEVETNESFPMGEVNYTIYANDTSGNEINVSGNFSVIIPDDTNKYYVRNSSGENVAWFGDWGNIVLEGSCFVADCSSPGDDSLIVRNSSLDYVAYVNSTGDMCISSGACSDESANCDSPVDALAIRNESEDVVSYINGSLCLVGGLYENVEL